MRIFLTVSFLLLCFIGFSQNQRKFNLRCAEGDTLINDPYCDWCQVGETYYHYGVTIESPSQRFEYIRHPYTARGINDRFIEITYDRDSVFLVDKSFTVFENTAMKVVLDSLNGCPTAPEVPGTGCTRIDTMYIANDSICIALDCDTTLFCQDLSQYRDSLSVGGVTVYREYWTSLNTDQLAVTVNGGSLPTATRQIFVNVEGIKQKEGAAGVGDYTVNGPLIEFNYTLEDEDVEVWFIDETGPVEVYREYFTGLNSSSFSVSVNGGVLPVLNQALKVFIEGQKLSEGPNGDYEITGNSINLKYTLEDEDAEVWFIMNTSDVGFLGLFR
jgi:hypothetical protein